MAMYRLLKHKDYDRSVRNLPPSIQQKALWAQVLLGTRGRTPSVKGTTGFDLRWRRTPVQGNHFYMWWIPQSESGLTNGHSANDGAVGKNGQSILIHSVRHHDATSLPIAPGYLYDYEEIAVADLDPRFAEQRMVAKQLDSTSLDAGPQRRPIALSTVKGLPGSGKTISLLYLVRDLLQRTGQGQILYITYTSRLKRAAEEFLLAQDGAYAERVKLKTLSEVQSEFTGIASPPESFKALDDFCKFLDVQNTSSLGAWRRYPQALYTEIRSHLLGRDFPAGFELLGTKIGETSTRLEPLDARGYAKMRKLNPDSAEIAQQVSIRAAASRFFQEQKAAKRAMEILLSGRMPPWLANIKGILVDEVQDLTLLQIAFLGELVKTAVDVQNRQQNGNRFSSTPFVFTVAGDESQIVQPTGFDWGITKELLSKQLDIYPSEFEFQHQRRSPRVLAELVENSWNFYSHLPKRLRPSARRDAFVDESIAADHQYEDGGRIFLCGDLIGHHQNGYANGAHHSGYDPTTRYVEETRTIDWYSLFEEMVDKPGRILIDLTEKLRSVLSDSTRSMSDEVLFLSREIKGLERANVIVYGLNALYERATLLCDDAEDGIPLFEARRLFDEVRVAVSRSTNTLILLEPPTAPVLKQLNIDAHALASPEINVISWGDLLDILRTEEMSELEAIERYLDEVDDLMERGRWEWAYRRNRRAHALAVEIKDQALQRDANAQQIEITLQEAASLFADEDWRNAYERNREGHRLALASGDPLILERVDAQVQKFRSTLSHQAGLQHEQAQNWLRSGSYKMALRDVKSALNLAEAIQDDEHLTEIRATNVSICTEWAYQLTASNGGNSHLGSPLKGTNSAGMANAAIPNVEESNQGKTDVEHARQLMAEAIILEKKTNAPSSELWQVILDRYKAVLQLGHFSSLQIEKVITFIRNWEAQADRFASQDGASTHPSMQFALRWIDEVYQNLGAQLHYYYDWAAAAELVIERAELHSHSTLSADGEPMDATLGNDQLSGSYLSSQDFDDYLWDLENRVDLALDENPNRTKRTQRALDQFSAFKLGYDGNHAEAAQQWNTLGNVVEAARQARRAGQLEFAYDLLRRAKAHIPEELAVSVKAVRLLDQLAAKHEGLNAAEKESLAKRLAEIHKQLNPILTLENPPSDIDSIDSDDEWVIYE